MTLNFELVAGPFTGETNGPVWDGEAILFSAVGENRVLRMHPATSRIAEHRRFTAGTRGLALDAIGQLYGCQSGARRICRFNADATLSMLADRLGDGQLHNQPYDLVIDGAGRIWFTDPDAPPRTMEPLMGYAAVLRLDPQSDGGWVLWRMTSDTSLPKGIALSSNGQTLYVADNKRNGGTASALLAYTDLNDGRLAEGRAIYNFDGGTLNGLCLDRAGNLVVCAEGADGGEILVISEAGECSARYPFPEAIPTNCAFGGNGLDTLYITASNGCLYRARA